MLAQNYYEPSSHKQGQEQRVNTTSGKPSIWLILKKTKQREPVMGNGTPREKKKERKRGNGKTDVIDIYGPPPRVAARGLISFFYAAVQ